MISDKDRMAHETLLKEIHLVDNLLETHANIMIVLISGMLYFIFKIESVIAAKILSVLGLAVSLEFFCHIYRLKHVAKSAMERLIEIEKRIGIDTGRRKTVLLGIRIPSGSTLILYISVLFIAIWLVLIGFLVVLGTLTPTILG